jgi:hypothetical protein
LFELLHWKSETLKKKPCNKLRIDFEAKSGRWRKQPARAKHGPGQPYRQAPASRGEAAYASFVGKKAAKKPGS